MLSFIVSRGRSGEAAQMTPGPKSAGSGFNSSLWGSSCLSVNWPAGGGCLQLLLVRGAVLASLRNARPVPWILFIYRDCSTSAHVSMA